MLNVRVPEDFYEEIKYTLDVLITEFLGLDVKYVKSPFQKDILIDMGEGNSLILKNSFFSNFEKNGDYLKSSNIPSEVLTTTNQFTVEDNLPIIYGDNQLLVSEREIICGIDIVASTFFMLSRWEEYVNENKDKHNRFHAAESLAYKHGFLDRAIVNEYLEMLWNMMQHLGIKEARKQRTFQMRLTHDVDSIYYLNNSKQLIRAIGGDLIRRKNIPLALNRVKEFIQIKRKAIKDPYDTFDWMMDLSEQNNLRSEFYFMSGGTSSFDNRYLINDINTIDIIEKIKTRGHVVGFHPSYNAYNNHDLWNKEVTALRDVANSKVNAGRHHYLRFEVPGTWQIWEDNGMDYDSTLSYAEELGFRCGVCYEYSVFNILTRQKLRLKEKPLIVMEVTLASYKGLSPEKMYEEIMKYLEKCKKYNGEFVFLWHNSNFNDSYWKDYKEVYQKVVESNRTGSL